MSLLSCVAKVMYTWAYATVFAALFLSNCIENNNVYYAIPTLVPAVSVPHTNIAHINDSNIRLICIPHPCILLKIISTYFCVQLFVENT